MVKWIRSIWRRVFRNELFISVDQVRRAWGLGGTGKVGQGLDSNVVMAPVQWIMRTFTQSAPVVELRESGRRWQRLDDHPLERLLDRPNEFYDGDTLAKAKLLSFFLDGNAYVRKIRSPLMRVVELWYIPHWLIEPDWPEDGSSFISHYTFRPWGEVGQAGPAVEERIPVDDIVHLRFGLDPRNPRLGLSPIKAALREVLTDEEASKFAAFILSNMGVPGGIISPDRAAGDTLPASDDIEEMKEYMASQFRGERRGNWLVLGVPTKVEQFGFDPNTLQLGPLRDISEERVCAMLGVPAAVVGFGAGLQQTKVGATMRELVRLARVSCIEPNQKTIAVQLGRQLLPEFEPRHATAPRHRVAYDNSGLGMFQEDETEVAKRARNLYQGGVATKNEARAMVGLEVAPEGDGFVGESSSGPASGGGDPAGLANRLRDVMAEILANGGNGA